MRSLIFILCCHHLSELGTMGLIDTWDFIPNHLSHPINPSSDLFYYPPDLIRILNQFLQILIILLFQTTLKLSQL